MPCATQLHIRTSKRTSRLSHSMMATALDVRVPGSQYRARDVWITVYRCNVQLTRQVPANTVDYETAGQQPAAGDCMLKEERTWIPIPHISHEHFMTCICQNGQTNSSVTVFVRQMEQFTGRYTRQTVKQQVPETALLHPVIWSDNWASHQNKPVMNYA